MTLLRMLSGCNNDWNILASSLHVIAESYLSVKGLNMLSRELVLHSPWYFSNRPYEWYLFSNRPAIDYVFRLVDALLGE